MTKKWFTLILIGILWGISTAEAQRAMHFSGKVLSVEDGDSLTIKLSNGHLIHLQLAGIDAPDLDQPNGYEAKQALIWKVKDTSVLIRIIHNKETERITGDLFVGAQYINQEMISEGWARSTAAENTKTTVQNTSHTKNQTTTRLALR